MKKKLSVGDLLFKPVSGGKFIVGFVTKLAAGDDCYVVFHDGDHGLIHQSWAFHWNTIAEEYMNGNQ